MKHPAADLLAQDLGRLQHTNDRGETGIIALPGFMTAGMSEEQAAETLGPLAVGLCEAMIETLDVRHGYVVVERDEIERRAAELAAEANGAMSTDGVAIHCNRCRQPVIHRLRMTDPTFVKVHVPTLLGAFREHAENCKP